MKRRNYPLAVMSLLSISVLAAVLVLILVLLNTSANPLGSPNAAVAPASVAATLVPTTQATPTPAPTPSDVTVIVPKVSVGEVIPMPFDNKPVNVTLRRLAEAPLISLQEARLAVHNLGISWATGGQVNGRTVKLTAAYGLADLGGPGPNGAWYGPRNVPIRNCDDKGNCTSTGVVLDHIEKRPVWVLDYGNTVMEVSGPPPDTCKPACTPIPNNNHSVYTVDAQTKDVIVAEFYYTP